MFNFNENLYTDVRIEDVYETNITIDNNTIKQSKIREYKGAFIRVFDGYRWYYSSTTNINKLQDEIDNLSNLATPNKNINHHPIVQNFEVNIGNYLKYSDVYINNITKDEKLSVIKKYSAIFEDYPKVNMWSAIYKDTKKVKYFYSSKGANLTFDNQNCAIIFRYKININGKTFAGQENIVEYTFDKLHNQEEKFKNSIKKDIDYISKAVPVKAGKYTVVLSPMVTGIFAHESFGHKSEADFMVGDETMIREWKIGKDVGIENLNIIDDGNLEGIGYTPFDDEGTKAKKNYIIKDGKLAGRMHSSSTSSSLNEKITSNARAVSFEFEPIVRMTTTYIDNGNLDKNQLMEDIVEGIYVDNLSHGSGMTTFTLAPLNAYMIRNGKIAEPVLISVISGNVMETLFNIDGISNTLEILSFATGGCGKMEQAPLPVSFGGPFIRVKSLDVQ